MVIGAFQRYRTPDRDLVRARGRSRDGVGTARGIVLRDLAMELATGGCPIEIYPADVTKAADTWTNWRG